jgi:hypothetical protein
LAGDEVIAAGIGDWRNGINSHIALRKTSAAHVRFVPKADSRTAAINAGLNRGITNFRQQLMWTEGFHRVYAGELPFGRQRQDRLMYREKDSKSIRRSGCS